MKYNAELSAERLREFLRYDVETGDFIRLLPSVGPRAKVGDRAGRVMKEEGYIQISVDGKRYLAHRLAVLYMTGSWPENEVDHIDRDRANNAWANLRLATRTQNQTNRLFPRAADLPRGVARQGNQYIARLMVDRKLRSVGKFGTSQEASNAYRLAVEEIRGPFLPQAGP